jgi:NitT/TauT family transport system substrate-binding protein
MLQYLAVKNGLAVSDIKRLGVGAGNSFIVAMTKKTIACGLTTEPTISEVVNKKVGFVLLDLRTPSGTKNGLGGLYPATSLNVRNSSAADNKATVQKMVNAFARTMHWIDTHSAAQITSKMPASYYATSGKSVYVAALTASKEMFTSNGLMPVGGPESVLKVISSFNPAIKGKEIDLSKTYTNSFAEEANSNLFGSPTG